MDRKRSVHPDELKEADRMPSPTGVALAVLRLTDAERTTAQEVARVLEGDPAMAGRILRVVNSAASGLPRPVASVKDAVRLLGMRAIRSIALGFSLVSEFGAGRSKQFNYGAFWARSLATALGAQALARHLQGPSPEEAFTCGLLCQVGQLALATIYPQEYDALLIQAGQRPASELVHAEQESLATDHNQLTAALLQKWGLSADFIDAAMLHEGLSVTELSAGSDQVSRLAQILNVASHLSSVCAAAPETQACLLLELFARARALGINQAALIPLADSVVSAWQDWGKILELSIPMLPPFAELVQRGAAPVANPSATPALEPSGAPQGIRILVQSPDASERAFLQQHLKAAGHAVFMATDDESALRVIVEENPQVFLASSTGLLNRGFTLSKSLHETRIGQRLQIILLTDARDEESMTRLLDTGVNDYLLRPLVPRLLAFRIRAAQRMIRLQEEMDRDKEELRRYAADLAVANRRLQRAALEDALTGLPNRRFAMERLAQEWDSHAPTGRPLACILADIDFFKRINDTYGHDVGDEVLRSTAAVMREAVRTADVVCRLGGEEFLIICPDTNLCGVGACGERIRRRVESHEIQLPGFTGSVTVSLGAAVLARTMSSLGDLLKAADQALYRAKHSGRNRLCFAAEEGEQAALLAD